MAELPLEEIEIDAEEKNELCQGPIHVFSEMP